jgi:hypothetical protein
LEEISKRLVILGRMNLAEPCVYEVQDGKIVPE